MNYISIKSVLFDLTSLIPEQNWNEDTFTEWAIKGFMKIAIHAKYENKVCTVPVVEHKATVPSDCKYIIQIAYKTDSSLDSETPDYLTSSLFISSTNGIGWKSLKLATNNFHNSLLCPINIFEQNAGAIAYNYMYNIDCGQHEYTIDHNLNITTTLPSGTLLVSYLRYPKSDCDDFLIPDDEDLKEALTHYVSYRYWLGKDFMKEEGADRRMMFHLSQYQTLKAKAAGKINQPSEQQLEIIKNYRDSLTPSTHQHDQFFSRFNQREPVGKFVTTKNYRF